MFSSLLIIGFIQISAAYSNTEVLEDVCGKLNKTFEEYDCVVSSECTILNKLIHNDEVVSCGIDTDTDDTKLCCPKSSRRFRRQIKASSQKNPYAIAQQKCIEYANARYVIRRIPSEIPNRQGIVRKKLDCPTSIPLIIGGEEAKLKEFPHMALIGFSSRPEDPVSETEWNCGGTLISDRFVLTAAHCGKSGDYVPTWVRLGELVLNNDGDSAQPKDFRIVERIPHPQYRAPAVYFDIMLLRLRDRVEFSPHMRPICLYTSPILSSSFNNGAIITGWGNTATDEVRSEALLKAGVNFTDGNECIATYKSDKKLAKGFDPTTMVCAGNKVHGNDTCRGDSGGPLQVPLPNWTCMYWQVGITSYGAFICGTKGISTIYSRVSYYIPWIQSIVWP